MNKFNNFLFDLFSHNELTVVNNDDSCQDTEVAVEEPNANESLIDDVEDSSNESYYTDESLNANTSDTDDDYEPPPNVQNGNSDIRK